MNCSSITLLQGIWKVISLMIISLCENKFIDAFKLVFKSLFWLMTQAKS